MVLSFSSRVLIKYSVCGLALILSLLISCKQSGTSNTLSYGAVKRLEQGILKAALNTDPAFLDWNKASDTTSATVIIHLMRGLYYLDGQGNAVPDLVEAETHNKEQTVYRFKLKPNIRWSDGQAFEAQQVLDSWVRLLAPQTAASKAEDLWVLKNGREFQTGQISDVSLLGLKIIDHLNIEVTLARPFPSLPLLLTRVWTFPIRKELIGKWGDRWSEPPQLITLGPYVLHSWQHDYKLILEANTLYFPQPYFKTIEYLIIQSIEARRDLFDNFELDYGEHVPLENYAQFIGRPEFKQAREIGIYYLRFNTRKSPTDSKVLRQALSLALNKKEIVTILGGGISPATSYLIPSVFEYEPNLTADFDPIKAQKLLVENKIDSAKIKLPLGLNANPSQRLIMENIQHQWKKNLGIACELQEFEWKVYLQQIRVDPPPVFRMSYISGLTAYDYLKKFEPGSDESLLFSSTANANQYAHWMQQVLLAPTLKARKEAASAAQKMLFQQEWAVLPIYYIPGNDLIHTYLDQVLIRGDSLVDFSRAIFKK